MLSSRAPAGSRRLDPHVLQRRFDRREDDIQAKVDQVNSGQRNDYVSANDGALVQDVVEDIEKRSFICRVRSRENNVVRSRHIAILYPTPTLSSRAEQRIAKQSAASRDLAFPGSRGVFELAVFASGDKRIRWPRSGAFDLPRSCPVLGVFAQNRVKLLSVGAPYQ
jgi:hypothetical protein